MRKQSLEDILKKKKIITYNEQYSYVIQLIEKGKIKPVKASPTNGRRPTLHIQYWIIEDAVDYSELFDKILEHPEALGNMDKFLRPLLNRNPEKIYNMEKVLEFQRVRLNAEEEMTDETEDFDEEAWRAEQERLRQQKLSKYRLCLTSMLAPAVPKGKITLSKLVSIYSKTKSSTAIKSNIIDSGEDNTADNAAAKLTEEEQVQKGIAFSDMLRAYEALRSDEKGRRQKTTKEGFVYGILIFLSAFVILTSLLYYMRRDETDVFADRNEGKVL